MENKTLQTARVGNIIQEYNAKLDGSVKFNELTNQFEIFYTNDNTFGDYYTDLEYLKFYNIQYQINEDDNVYLTIKIEYEELNKIYKGEQQ